MAKSAQNVEAVPAEEPRYNALKVHYGNELESFQQNLMEKLTKEGVFDYGVIAQMAAEEMEKFFITSGLVPAVSTLIDIVLELADIPVADIPDKALKRTILRVAKAHDFKIVDIRELIDTLNVGNAEAEFEAAKSAYEAIKHDHEVAVRLSHQYDAMKVPKELIRRFDEAKGAYEAALAKYPHLVK